MIALRIFAILAVMNLSLGLGSALFVKAMSDEYDKAWIALREQHRSGR